MSPPARRSTALLLALSSVVAGCRAESAQLLVEVDAGSAVLAKLRTITLTVYDGDEVVDSTEITPTHEPPSCLPLSIGVAPASGGSGQAVGIGLRASLASGGAIVQRVDTTFAPGARVVSFYLDDGCLERAGCDRSVRIDPPEPVDRAELERRISRQECRRLPTPTECLNQGGCFESPDLIAPVCELPCTAPLIEPAPPEPAASPRDPAPPVFLPCPTGWSERPPEAELRTCEPWPSGATPDCPPGSAAFPGDAACAPLSPCPVGQWPEGLFDGPGVVFVDPSAPAGGGGTSAAPYRDLAEALDATPAGGTIVLSAGAHPSRPLRLDRPLGIVGACAERTVIVGSTRDVAPLLAVTAANVAITGLSISPAYEAIEARGGALTLGSIELSRTSSAGLVFRDGATVHLAGVVSTGGGGPALVVETGATVIGERVGVRAARGAAIVVRGRGSSARLEGLAIASSEPDAGGLGQGLRVTGGGQAHVERAVIEGTRGQGAWLEGAGSALFLGDSVLRDPEPSAGGLAAGGLYAGDGSAAALSRVSVTSARGTGIDLSGGASLTLADVALLEPSSGREEEGLGQGIRARGGARVVGDRVWIQRARHRAVELTAARGALADLTIRDTRDEDGGLALAVGEAARLDVARAYVSESRRLAVSISGRASVAQLADVRIERTLEDGDRRGGGAIHAEAGARLTLLRAALSDNLEAAIRLDTSTATAASARLEDLVIRDTRPSSPEADNGYGIVGGRYVEPYVAHVPLDLTVRRAQLARCSFSAIALHQTHATIEDVSARATELGLATRSAGYGLLVSRGGRVTGARVALDANTDAGLLVTGPDAEVHLTDATIRETGCPEDETFCGVFHGAGVALQFGGHVELERFLLEGNRQNGIQLNFEATADLRDGEIARHPTGAYVRAGAFDVQRIGVRVHWRDNGENVRFGDEP